MAGRTGAATENQADGKACRLIHSLNGALLNDWNAQPGIRTTWILVSDRSPGLPR